MIAGVGIEQRLRGLTGRLDFLRGGSAGGNEAGQYRGRLETQRNMVGTRQEILNAVDPFAAKPARPPSAGMRASSPSQPRSPSWPMPVRITVSTRPL